MEVAVHRQPLLLEFGEASGFPNDGIGAQLEEATRLVLIREYPGESLLQLDDPDVLPVNVDWSEYC